MAGELLRVAFTVNTTRGRRKIEIVGASLEDVRASLAPFGKYLRAKAKARFAEEGPGWPALAQSTGHRLIHTKTSRVTVAGDVRQSARVKQLRKALQRDVKQGAASHELLIAFELSTRSTGGGRLGAAIRRQLAQKQDARVLRYMGELQNIAKELDREASGKRRKGKRAIARHRLLGRLATSLQVVLEKRSVVLRSRASKFAGIHNDGGVGGHGAHIPARTFNELEPEDIDELVKMIRERALARMNRGPNA